MKIIINIFILVTILYSNLSTALAFETKVKILKIGTGNKNALAYPTINSICKIYNKHKTNKNILCKAVETGGSNENLDKIVNGNFEAGVIKNDMQYNAYNGIGKFSKNPKRDLRALFGLHMEYFSVLVKKDSNLTRLGDVRNTRVYIGNQGSGSRIFVEKFFRRIGLEKKYLSVVYENTPDKLYDLFCNNKIDFALYLVGHPNNIFNPILKDCNVRFISLSRKEIENYIDLFRYIIPSKIPKNTYKNQKEDVVTFASQLLLTTSKNVEDRIIYDFIKTIFENFDEIKKEAPTLRNISLDESLKNANNIPFHKAASRYYKTILPD